MSLKTLIFGNSQLTGKLLHSLNPSIPILTQQTIRVQTLSINQKPFMLFGITQRSLIQQQSIGTNALIFFLDHTKPLYQQKQFLLEILSSRKQFQTVPLVVAFQKDQQFNIKDVINYLELFKMKERTSMIRELEFRQPQVKELFNWVDSQLEFRKSRTMFDAVPKVVRMKPKYRETDQDQSVKKYQNLLKDKELRNKNVKDQQQTYINMEKQRIKSENMQKQLANFNKNKKKMTPYDIKATPNPKIQANLHFFLKDPKSQKQSQANIKIQTDQFKPLPPALPYIPKKTGINISTQIQPNQLFSFDLQVRPILNILVIKALQTAQLEIQQQEEFNRIEKYKAAYVQRVKKQNQHQNRMIEDQVLLIKKKEKLLEEARRKHQIKRNIKKRIICYDLGNRFLQDIYKKANLSLYNKNQYFDPYENQIKTNYLDTLVSKTAAQMKNLAQKQQSIKGVFDKDCIQALLKKSQVPKKSHQQKVLKQQQRLINNSQDSRILPLQYIHHPQSYSSFSKHISRHFDLSLQQHLKAYQQQLQQISDKISTGQINQDQLIRLKERDDLKFGQNHEAFLLHKAQLAFIYTPNRYQRVAGNLMDQGYIVMDKEGELVQINWASRHQDSKYVKKVNNLRNPKNTVNMDQGLLFNLKEVPENTKSIILLTKFNKVSKYTDPQAAKVVKYSSYGLQFYENNIQIHKQNIAQKISFAQIIKAPQGEQLGEPKQECIICVSYIMHKKADDQWNIQHVRYTSKSLKQEQKQKFIDQVGHFYSRSLQISKQEQQQQRATRSPTSKKGQRSQKTKKILQQPPKPKPTKLTTRIFPLIKINLHLDILQIKEQIQDVIKGWKQLVQSCQDGWEILVKGKSLDTVDQLKKCGKVGDLVVKRVIKVVEERKDQEGDKEQQQQQEEA